MKFNHILKLPGTGKTREITRQADEKSIVIFKRSEEAFNHKRGLEAKGAIVLVAGQALVGFDYSKRKKIFIDELLSFREDQLKWLWDELPKRFRGDQWFYVQKYIYSTPTKSYKKETYMNAKLMEIVHQDSSAYPQMTKQQMQQIKADVLELKMCFLLDNRDGGEVTLDKSYGRGDLDHVERMLGQEQYDVMYNLNIWK